MVKALLGWYFPYQSARIGVPALAQAVESPPPMWVIQTKLELPGCSLAQPQLSQVFREQASIWKTAVSIFVDLLFNGIME